MGRQVIFRSLLLETVAKTPLYTYLYIFVSFFLLHESSRILILKPISSKWHLPGGWHLTRIWGAVLRLSFHLVILGTVTFYTVLINQSSSFLLSASVQSLSTWNTLPFIFVEGLVLSCGWRNCWILLCALKNFFVVIVITVLNNIRSKQRGFQNVSSNGRKDNTTKIL